MACSSCGQVPSNPNPLDSCTRSFLQCNNPCDTPPGECHLLPTQIDTFTTQFFGPDLTKANVNNQVAWNLPCSLSQGLIGNPRLAGESLACYFARLFALGIPGVLGPQGNTGTTGAAGQDAFTITLQDFVQPTLQAPYISITTQPASFFVPNLYVLIERSGWYQILNILADGTMLLQLISPVLDALPIIPSGSFMAISGFPGVRTIGPKGERGDTGPAGIPGVAGIQGFTGAQGAQGPDTALYFAQAGTPTDTNYGIGLTTSYQALIAGASFFTPDGSDAHAFVSFRFGMLASNDSGSITGSLLGKIGIFDSGGVYTGVDVAGSERIVTASSGVLEIFFDYLAPFLDHNNSGAVRGYGVLVKSSGLTGTGFQLLGRSYVKMTNGFMIP